METVLTLGWEPVSYQNICVEEKNVSKAVIDGGSIKTGLGGKSIEISFISDTTYRTDDIFFGSILYSNCSVLFTIDYINIEKVEEASSLYHYSISTTTFSRNLYNG